MAKLSDRVDRLESLLGQFIVNTDVALRRLETSLEVFKDEMKVFKEEMIAFRNEVNEDRKRINKMWGELANKMGTLVEDIVAPNIPGIAKRYFGVEELDYFAVRVRKRNVKDRSKIREFDVIAVWDDKVIINETKSIPRIEYINEFIEVLKEIGDYFPEYKDKEIIPIFSSLYLSDEIVKYLTKRKIYAMATKDDTMDLLNFEKIKR
ncbi:MAG: hypothetical protein ACP5K6_09005 [Dictyoglomus sp.]|uniref:hypothetical protein n=1 Tax=Dictyoglomus sp. TaxID=28205 RepID=UPI000CCE6BB2|nr:MAG: hypothetical protein C0196_07590 [Dictyoglomus turgidum]